MAKLKLTKQKITTGVAEYPMQEIVETVADETN